VTSLTVSSGYHSHNRNDSYPTIRLFRIINPVDLESLRCFDAVATTLNFRAAAGRVHLSPTALSDRIKRLEEELDRRLFNRTTRKVTLTDDGMNLLPLARDVLASASRLTAAAKGALLLPPFELFVGTRFELGLSWLCPALTPLGKRRPERTVHLHFADSPDLLARLERGDLDAVVSSGRLTSPRLTYAALHPEEYVFVSRPQIRVRGPEDVRELTLVDVSPDLPLFRYLLDAIEDSSPWPFAKIEYLGGIGGIRHRLLEGNRVAVLPKYFVRDDLAKKRLTPLMRGTHLRSDAFRLIWRTKHPRESSLLDLANDLRTFPLR
jgi:LysR family glycine cleavage system transcriptional activator